MRRWLIGIAALIVIAVAVLALAVANLDGFVNRNRDALAAQAESALGRPVEFGDVGISFRGGLGLRVDDVRIGDDPAWSQGDLVGADRVDVQVALWPALFGEIEVDRVVLRGPEINLIRTEKGLNAAALGTGADADAPPGEPAGPSPALLVALVDVRDGTVRYVDRTAQPPIERVATQVDFSASDVRLDAPVAFELEAAVLGADRQNVRVAGTVGPIASDAAPSLDLTFRGDALDVAALMAAAGQGGADAGLEASGTLDLDIAVSGTPEALRVVLDADGEDALLKSASYEKPAREALRLRAEALGGATEVRIEKMSLELPGLRLEGEAMVTGLDATQAVAFKLRSGELRPGALMGDPEAAEGAADVLRDVVLEGTLRLPSAGPDLAARLDSPKGTLGGAPYSELRARFAGKGERWTLEKASVSAFGGQIELEGNANLAGAEPRIALATRVAGVSLEEILASQSPSAAGFATGTLGFVLDVAGTGTDWAALQKTLLGSGNLRVREGRIRDVNLAEATLSGVTGMGGLANLLPPSLREKYPHLFGVGDTEFEDLDAKLEIRDGFVFVRDLDLEARDYALRGEGRYALSDDLDLSTRLVLSRQLSADLVEAVRQAGALAGPDGRIVIPAKLKGPLPGKPVPDAGFLAHAASRGALRGVLQGAFGGSPPDAAEERTDGGTDAAPPEDPKPATTAEDAARHILKGLLGGPRPKDEPGAGTGAPETAPEDPGR